MYTHKFPLHFWQKYTRISLPLFFHEESCFMITIERMPLYAFNSEKNFQLCDLEEDGEGVSFD